MLRSSVVLKNAMTIFVRQATTEEAVLLNSFDEETFTPTQPADNPCAILKVEVIAGQRRFGGVITGMLACGVVANVRPTAGAVPASLMCGMASEIYKISAKIVQHHLRQFLHVCYVRAEAGTVWDDLNLMCLVFSFPSHDISFSHMCGHRSRNHDIRFGPQPSEKPPRFFAEDHALHTPEVQIEWHPEGKVLKKTFTGFYNAWLDSLLSNVRHMSVRTSEVYTLLVADRWNEFIVRPDEVAQLPRHGPQQVARKRRRD